MTTFPPVMRKRTSAPVGLLVPGIGIPLAEAVRRHRDSTVFRRTCLRAGIEDYPDLVADGMVTEGERAEDSLEKRKLSYVLNCFTYQSLFDEETCPDYVIGYSMGLYSGLHLAGYCTFETGLKLVEFSHHVLESWCASRPLAYGMGIILGLTESEIRTLVLDGIEDSVDISVFNGKRSFVLSGEKPSLDAALSKAASAGAMTARPLATGHPYHHRVLQGVAAPYSSLLQGLRFHFPRSRVISICDGRVLDAEDVPQTIVREIHSPLHLDHSIHFASREFGLAMYYEVGGSDSMKKLVRYIDRSIPVETQVISQRNS